MKLYIFFVAVFMLLVQTFFIQATPLTQSFSDNNNLKRMSSAWGKRMSSAWGKRMSSAWGKRSDIDDDYSNHLLRELFYQAHLNKYDYPRYPIDNEAIEQYLAQRTIANNDDESASQNSS